jgi:hypothetical protein
MLPGNEGAEGVMQLTHALAKAMVLASRFFFLAEFLEMPASENSHEVLEGG